MLLYYVDYDMRHWIQDGVVISDEGEIYIHGIEPNHYNQVILLLIEY